MRSSLLRFDLEAPVLTDGAWGTALQTRGLGIGECPDLWNLDQAARVEEVARSYVEAGSRVILTNTFGASRPGLDRYGCGNRVAEINRRGVEISRRAAGDAARVFASMGPTGKLLVMGDVSEQELADAFGEQAAALADGGADAIVIETMSDPAEAVQAVRAARTTGLPVVASMTYDSGKDGHRTMMGVTIEQATAALEAAGADAIGANCGQGVEGFVAICARLRTATDLPLWLKANAGLPELVAGRAKYNTLPAEFAERVLELVNAGADFIGGCCGTDADFIRALHARLLDRKDR